MIPTGRDEARSGTVLPSLCATFFSANEPISLRPLLHPYKSRATDNKKNTRMTPTSPASGFLLVVPAIFMQVPCIPRGHGSSSCSFRRTECIWPLAKRNEGLRAAMCYKPYQQQNNYSDLHWCSCAGHLFASHQPAEVVRPKRLTLKMFVKNL
jgi:hypothetical protein